MEKGKRDREELLQKLEEYEVRFPAFVQQDAFPLTYRFVQQLPAEIAALKEEVETLYDQNYTLMSLLASVRSSIP